MTGRGRCSPKEQGFLSLHPHQHACPGPPPSLPRCLQHPPYYPTRLAPSHLLLHVAAGGIFLKPGKHVSPCLRTRWWISRKLRRKLGLLTMIYRNLHHLAWPPFCLIHAPSHMTLFLAHQEHCVLSFSLSHCETLLLLGPWPPFSPPTS